VAVVCVAGPADVLTIDAWDGHLIWRTTLDDHPYAAILSSGTISRSVFYVGTSFDSEKAKAETSSNGETPTATTVGFRGGFYALNLRTKRSEWSGPWNPFSGSTTPTVYENEGETEGFYGIDVIASTPPVDEDARTVFFVTGPLVAEGAAFRGSDSISNLSTCLEATTATRFYDELECMRRFAPTVYPNALVAVDAASGETKFVVPMSAKRSWEEACEGRVAEDEVCPSVSFHVAFQGGPFVNLLPSNPALWIDPSRSGKFLVISEKTGVVWKFDSATGDAIWASKTCPGGHWGGVAVNPSGTICASCVNEHHQAWRLLNSSTSTATLEGPSHCGGWVGIDAITGLTLWTTPDPTCGDGAESPFDTFGTGMSATAFAIAPPVSVLNGFVVASASARYVPDSATGSPVPGAGGGLVCVLEEKTGSIASSFETGTSICQGISSDSDKLYVASGCDPSVAGGVLSDGNAVFGWKLKIY
jgi:polyvinyl alcohol dehydrogenase (cytochrome)